MKQLKFFREEFKFDSKKDRDIYFDNCLIHSAKTFKDEINKYYVETIDIMNTWSKTFLGLSIFFLLSAYYSLYFVTPVVNVILSSIFLVFFITYLFSERRIKSTKKGIHMMKMMYKDDILEDVRNDLK